MKLRQKGEFRCKKQKLAENSWKKNRAAEYIANVSSSHYQYAYCLFLIAKSAIASSAVIFELCVWGVLKHFFMLTQ